MIFRTDYHIHTLYSDGKGWPEDYISHAIKSGLSEIGFSDHLTLTDQQQPWSILPERLNEYCERIKNLGENTRDIKVKLGLEVDYFPDREEQIREILERLPLDFVIGSVHYLADQSVDIGPEFYENRDIDRLFDSYFSMVEKAASSRLFDIIGHPDLVRIFRYHPANNPASLYKRLAGSLADSDIAFELNTNGMNKPLSDFYPDRRFLHLFSEAGVPVCINSDAHTPAKTAQYFDEAYALVIAAGFRDMAVFDRRVRKMVPIPGA
ncbi:MAG: histidinol-phosphatase [Bacteroidales bacterium]